LDKYLKYIPLSLFCLYFTKALIFSISYPEAAILAVLGTVACYFQSKNNEEKLKDFESKILESNKAMEEKTLAAIQSFENKVKKVESIEAQINALKINSISRPINNVRQG
jgi:outer membrane lipopolysaccharide assembly protein LptE/RlpB